MYHRCSNIVFFVFILFKVNKLSLSEIFTKNQDAESKTKQKRKKKKSWKAGKLERPYILDHTDKNVSWIYSMPANNDVALEVLKEKKRSPQFCLAKISFKNEIDKRELSLFPPVFL